jgi:2-polyprenyl-6-hydroxyphenyl methylase/3-demethylubiquinone-9 3-methyltransferase
MNAARRSNRIAALDPAVRIDNDYYDGVGDAWWDARGPLRGLHEMNPARAGYVDRVLCQGPGAAGRRGVRVLDVGCGGGILTEELARLGYCVTGIDLAAGAIAAARRHAARSGLTVDYRVGSAYDLDVPDESIDAAVASDVLEHLHDLPRAVAEIARVLRPGGIFAFDTINRTARSYVVMILLGERLIRLVRPGTHNWRMFIRPAELTAVAAGHGLQMRDTTGLVMARPLPMVAVSLIRRGLLGGFTTGTSLAASYLGYAVKAGRISRTSAAPAEPAEQLPDRRARTEDHRGVDTHAVQAEHRDRQ